MNIILFGATGGIGKCLSYELSKNHNLFIGSRNKEKTDELVSEIKWESKYLTGGDSVDCSRFNSIENFLIEGNNFLGSIDCILNCVGSLMLKPAHMVSEDDLDSLFKTNVYSCFGILKYGFQFLKKKGGSVIFFSSAASKVGLKNHEAISSAKSAVSSIALSAAATYAPYNIRVNSIAPGLVETPLTEKIINNKMSLEYSKNLHGLKRIGSPKNFIPIINALIDKNSDWITGQTIFVDGGLSNVK